MVFPPDTRNILQEACGTVLDGLTRFHMKAKCVASDPCWSE